MHFMNLTTASSKSKAPLTERDLDFVSYLRALLVKRCQANPAYSLRAFAKQLGVEPSFLSKLFAGKRKLTLKLIERLAAPLLLSPAEVHQFKSRLIGEPTSDAGRDSHEANLTLDAFQVIADWYHYAILELTKIEGFEFQPAWISKKLGITVHEARDAIERLKRLEMLIWDEKKKKLKPVEQYSTATNPFTAPAFRKLQKQVLQQALVALENVPFEDRHQSSVTLAIHAPSLNFAKEKIAVFRKELSKTLQPEGKKFQEVYQFSISLFPAKNLKGTSHEN